MHRRFRSRRAGFTIIEALVVIILIGLAATFALPAVGRAIATTRVQRASAVMANDLKTAFAISAQQRRPIMVSVNAATRTFLIQSRDGSQTFRQTAYDGSSHLVLSQLSAIPASLVIFPSGLATDTMQITMQATAREVRIIRATRAGQVRITQP